VAISASFAFNYHCLLDLAALTKTPAPNAGVFVM
jgi:hypothetical protein